MSTCEAELCEYWTGQGCICAVIDMENTVTGDGELPGMWEASDLSGGWADSDEDDYYRQSATACCPRQTIPDSCSCLDGCACECLDCDCGQDEEEDW